MSLLIRTVITLVLAVFLYHYVDWMAMGQALAGVDFALFTISAIVFLASFGLLSWRLHLLLRPTMFNRLGLWRLFCINMSSLFYGFAVPADFGAAVARWIQITKNREGRALVALITVLERFMMVAATALLATAGLFFSEAPELKNVKPLALPTFALIFAASVLVIAVMVSQRLLNLFERLVNLLQARVESTTLHRILQSFWKWSEFHGVRSLLLPAVGVQLLYHGTLVIRFVLLFYAVGLELSIADITWISMAVLLLTTIPVTIAGLGVREGGFAALLGWFAIAPEIGVLLGLLTFTQYVGAVVWGGFAALLVRGDPTPSERLSE